MKIIELKVTHDENGAKFDYQKTLLAILRNHPQGMPIGEMEQAIRIIGVIRSANGKVALEDADHSYVVQRLEMTRWMFADPVVVDFVNDVMHARNVDANSDLWCIRSRRAETQT